MIATVMGAAARTSTSGDIRTKDAGGNCDGAFKEDAKEAAIVVDGKDMTDYVEKHEDGEDIDEENQPAAATMGHGDKPGDTAPSLVAYMPPRHVPGSRRRPKKRWHQNPKRRGIGGRWRRG